MTQRAGSLISGIVESFDSSKKQGSRAGAIQRFVSGGTSILTIYKNEGYYVAGSVWEIWITSGDPSTSPPSGHTLTQLQHTPLQ